MLGGTTRGRKGLQHRVPTNLSSAAPRTPATQLISLRREIAALERDLAEANAKASRAEQKLARFTTIGANGFGVSFGDIPVAQIWADFVLWETVLNRGEYRAVFELGTWKGGFAWWLWAQTQARHMELFETYDSLQSEYPTPAPEPERDTFVRRDVFAEAKEIGERMRKYEPCVVFCDNGNKPRELKTFSAELQHPDSILVVHDWGTEFQPEDVPDTVEMMYEEFCVELGSISRVFRLRRDA